MSGVPAGTPLTAADERMSEASDASFAAPMEPAPFRGADGVPRERCLRRRPRCRPVHGSAFPRERRRVGSTTFPPERRRDRRPERRWREPAIAPSEHPPGRRHCPRLPEPRGGGARPGSFRDGDSAAPGRRARMAAHLCAQPTGTSTKTNSSPSISGSPIRPDQPDRALRQLRGSRDGHPGPAARWTAGRGVRRRRPTVVARRRVAKTCVDGATRHRQPPVSTFGAHRREVCRPSPDRGDRHPGRPDPANWTRPIRPGEPDPNNRDSGRHPQAPSSAAAARAAPGSAAAIRSSASPSCAAETNQASNADGGR